MKIKFLDYAVNELDDAFNGMRRNRKTSALSFCVNLTQLSNVFEPIQPLTLFYQAISVVV